jgi:hypothetical protein
VVFKFTFTSKSKVNAEVKVNAEAKANADWAAGVRARPLTSA